MDSSYPDPQKLLAYVQGQLPAPEASALEQAITADPELAVEVEEMRLFAAAQGQQAAQKLAKHQRHIQQATQGQQGAGGRTSRFPWLGLAASLLVLLAVGFWWLRPQPTVAPEPAQLLAWQDSDTQRGIDYERKLRALSYGAAGDYAQAIDSLKAWLLDAPQDVEARLYLGRALALVGRQMEAQNLFFTIENDINYLPQTRLDAQWFRALVALNEDQIENACKILKNIVIDLGEKRQSQANALLSVHCDSGV